MTYRESVMKHSKMKGSADECPRLNFYTKSQ